MNKLLTEKEVADRLGISIEDVKKLVDSGKLPAYKIAGQYLRFKGEEVNLLFKKKPYRSIAESVKEFIYFYDFYIIAFIISLIILYFIFQR